MPLLAVIQDDSIPSLQAANRNSEMNMNKIFRYLIVLFNTLIVLIGLFCSCRIAEGKFQVNASRDKRDFLIFTVICNNILTDDQFKPLLKEAETGKSMPMVVDETRTIDTAVCNDLRTNIKEMKLGSIPDFLIKEFQNRNVSRTSIAKFKPPKPFTLTPHELDDKGGNFDPGNNKSIFIVRMSRPGYSRNSNQAFVLFSFYIGGRHSNYAFYYLRLRKGKWQIKTKHIQYGI